MATQRRYAENTEVTVDRSQTEALRLLKRYGADQTRVTNAEDRAILEFVLQGRLIRFLVAAPELEDPAFALDNWGMKRPVKQREAASHREYRRRWRSLILRLKAKLEAVTNDDVAVDEEFLAHLVVRPDGATVGDILLPQISEVYETGRVLSLMPQVSDRALPPYRSVGP